MKYMKRILTLTGVAIMAALSLHAQSQAEAQRVALHQKAVDIVAKMTLDEKLGPDAFSYYDTVSHGWKLDKGEYRILVGASSEDIRLEVKVKI